MVISVAFSSKGKYARASVSIQNKSANMVDVIPQHFSIKETNPKEKVLAFVSYETIVKKDANRAGWANALNAFGAGMATQQTTTRTSSSGSVNATGSDGTYANGTYSGTSTSTTSAPDYAAQARARENIQRRRDALSVERQTLAQAALKSNTLLSGQSIAGNVFFDFDSKIQSFVLLLPIADVVYEIPYSFEKH